MSKPFNTTLLDHALLKKRAENEQRRQETLRRVLHMLPQLATKYGFNRAYLFGSITQKGRFRKNSDIDIAVAGLSDEKYFAFIAEFSERLGREIDVVQIEKHRLEKRIRETAIEWNGND
ncbi:MAG: nucleotidyltransferase domain-containing protein [candidate division KSB1 bacterium]|nr:nucleotidyltransferase domain-containing protein [candidate division KSB1 bacterium]